jgi:hypothetical protein
VEAVLRKKMVLCSRIGGLPEAVGDDRLLVTPSDIDAWHQRLSQLVADPVAFHPAMTVAHARSVSFSLVEQARSMEQALTGMVLEHKRRMQDA